MSSYCNECEFCGSSPILRCGCMKVEPHHIFTEEDRQKYFLKGIEPEWCPLVVNYNDIKALLNKMTTVEQILDEFSRQLKNLGKQHFAHKNYLHIRQAVEDRLTETYCR